MKLVRTLCFLAGLIAAGAAFASGGDGYEDSIFVPRNRVPFPEQKAYAAGRVGIVSGQFFRIYLVLAWRSLHGVDLSAEELERLRIDEWRVGAVSEPDDGTAAWMKARALLVAPRADARQMWVTVRTADYAEFVNCTSDALDRAARTLRERLQVHGEADARWWLNGQDAVFANCAREETRGSATTVAPPMPEPAPPAAPAWLKADRAYQTAAALFYASRYPEARERFLAIADDKASPWQPLGRYLAARCLVRQATTAPTGDAGAKPAVDVKALLTRARAELVALSASDPAAKRLVGWVDARLRPAERASELALALQRGGLSNDERVMLMSDYLRLMDLNETTLDQAPDAMTAWIGLMQSVESKAAGMTPDTVKTHARERWQKDGDPAWLMPLAAQSARLDDLKPAELKAMRSVPREAPAYQTLDWHLARMALASSQAREADAAIDVALADTQLAPSTRNRWLALKLVSARSVDALLSAAPRAVAEPQGRDSKPVPDETKPVASGASTPAAPALPTAAAAARKDIDDDFAARLYGHMPLGRLVAVAAQPAFPASRRGQAEEVAFARALILQDWAVADSLRAAIAAPRTTTKALYTRYAAAQDPAQHKIAAALILVNTPELNPSWIDPKSGQAVEWGCRSAFSDDAGEGSAGSPSAAPRLSAATPVQFLSDAERTQARAERATLGALPIRSKWLADVLLPWAATKPDDTEAPKALALLVASTRMECPGAPQSTPRGQSKQAFDLLHKLWPRNEWTARTKYWF